MTKILDFGEVLPLEMVRSNSSVGVLRSEDCVLRLDWVQDFDPICSFDVYPMEGEFVDDGF